LVLGFGWYCSGLLKPHHPNFLNYEFFLTCTSCSPIVIQQT
jgi:hypothetical protein